RLPVTVSLPFTARVPAPLLRGPFTWTPPLTARLPPTPRLSATVALPSTRTGPVNWPARAAPSPVATTAGPPPLVARPAGPVALTAGVPAALLAKTPALVGGLAWAVPALRSSTAPAPTATAATPRPFVSISRRRVCGPVRRSPSPAGAFPGRVSVSSSCLADP